MDRSYFIPAETGRRLLDGLQRRLPLLSDTPAIPRDKPLCFNAQTYQRTNPKLAQSGDRGWVHTDADATVCAPMLLGVADGVEAMEEYGIDSAELPHDLLQSCAELAMGQLWPDQAATPFDAYGGPIELLKEAYEATESLGSTTVLLAIMDNRTVIHGVIQPMLAVLSVGDCELIVLRRKDGQQNPLTVMFYTNSGVQRVGGLDRVPIQVARVNESIDPEFTEDDALNVIERASAVSCVTVCEHDIVILGSDGVFDNLFVEEIVEICNDFMPRSDGESCTNVQPMVLRKIAERIVLQSHVKTKPKRNGLQLDAPIGKGGKVDDAAVIVAQVVEWTEDAGRAWLQRRGNFVDAFTCTAGTKQLWKTNPTFMCASLCEASDSDDDDKEYDFSSVDRSETTKLLVDI